MSWLLGIVGLLPHWIRLGAIATIIGSVAGFFWSWDARGKKVERQKVEIAALHHQLKVSNANMELRQGEIEALNARLVGSEEDLVNSCEALWKAHEGFDIEAIERVLDSIRETEEREGN